MDDASILTRDFTAFATEVLFPVRTDAFALMPDKETVSRQYSEVFAGESWTFALPKETAAVASTWEKDGETKTTVKCVLPLTHVIFCFFINMIWFMSYLLAKWTMGLAARSLIFLWRHLCSFIQGAMRGARSPNWRWWMWPETRHLWVRPVYWHGWRI